MNQQRSRQHYHVFIALLFAVHFTATAIDDSDVLTTPQNDLKETWNHLADRLVLPDGQRLKTWQDQTTYSKTYVVNKQHPQASDTNPGTAELPWLTINQAAQVLQPGEEVIIHAGIYREWVQPARGGTSDQAMIRYRAAEGERPIIDATEVWNGPFQRYNQWTATTRKHHESLLTAELPLDRFEVGYNPFNTVLYSTNSYFPFYKRPPAEYRRVLRYRGVMRYQGHPLPFNAGWHWEIPHSGPFYRIADDGRRLIFRLPDGIMQPETGSITVSARRHCFAPREFGLGYLSVQGLHLRGGSGGIPLASYRITLNPWWAPLVNR